MKKALFVDLDNTIYPVNSIGAQLFKALFVSIEKSGEFEGNLEKIKQEIQRTPFEKVAKAFAFSDKLTETGIKLLANLRCEFPMETFEDYTYLKGLSQKKFLITSGFTKLQKSKVDKLGIENDFAAILIIDLQKSAQTKKDVFEQIMSEQNYINDDVLVIGDDINSEIQAAKDLELDYIIYDKIQKYADMNLPFLIRNFKELQEYV
jgi:putative hydrolase of the HAD superfamily